MNKDKLVEQMLKEKGDVNNTIDLDAYASGLIDMFEHIEKLGQELPIHNVVGSTVWKPTMILRWYETKNYDPINDTFEKILQQKWQGDTGDEKWENIEVHER